jgi:hypothetical protein
MDVGHMIVLVLSVGVIIFLVLIEINSRRNEARRKAESAAKPVASAKTSGSVQAEPKRRAG